MLRWLRVKWFSSTADDEVTMKFTETTAAPPTPQFSQESIDWAIALAEERVVAVGTRWVAYATKESAEDAYEAMIDDGVPAERLSTRDFLVS